MTNDGLPPELPPEPPDWDALARHLAGECGPEEAQRVARWLESHPADAQALAAVNRAAESLTFSPSTDLDVSAALTRVRARMDEPVQRLQPRSVGRYPVSRRPRWIIPAISALAAGIVATIVISSRGSRPAGGSNESAAVQVVAIAPHVYSTAVGQRDSVTLSDSSRIVLGPDTRVTVPADYGQSRRAIEVHGIVYLNVRHDPLKPFSVRDAGAEIDDIGTKFTVEDDVDGTVSVTVSEGTVQLRPTTGDSAAGVTLTVGDRGVLDAAGRPRAYHRGASADDLAWTRGVLILRDAPLTRVATELQRWYGIELRVDSALAQRHVTTTFSGTPRDTVLRVIGLILGASVEERGDTDILHPIHGRSPPQ